ncbi:MAG: cytidylate kinase-like family protein [Myxococcota bacterium]
MEDQIRRWMAAQTRPVGPVTPVPRPHVVTVSREFGAQGEQLARVVAERMGYTCWDQELVHAIAESTQAPERLLESLDEHRRTSIDALAEVFRPASDVGDAGYLRELVRVVHTVAAQGRAVIVGRGCQFILGPSEALHVRVVAPVEHRVKGLVARRGWSEAQARAEVARVDADRKAFLKAGFGRDPTDPAGYDLVINLASFTLARAAEVVELAWAAKFKAD